MATSRKGERTGGARKDRTAYSKLWYLKNKTVIQKRVNAYQKTEGQRLRRVIIEHYGGKCNCCDEKIYSFLCIDHVNNDGNKIDRTKGNKRRSGFALYSSIIRKNFPDIYQILCFNCNNSKKNNGGVCIHKLINSYE